jgi:exopolyphosphatase/guanosine-5'-triphosphate,3'-diphosphate pyrophosphatase
MATIRRAVIDVGTNSVKVLVADVTAAEVKPVWEDSEQTRLGAGFFDTHRLQPTAIAHTAKAVAGFTAKAKELGAQSVRVIATSAARDAVNPNELVEAVLSAANLRMEIITGAREADWAFQGVQTDPQLAQHRLLLLDVGGGSTEFILGEGSRQDFRESFQMGTVRLLEKLAPSDPPTVEELKNARRSVQEFFQREVQPKLASPLAKAKDAQLVGTGGTATILARIQGGIGSYERGLIEGQRISAAQLSAQVDRLWSLPLGERKKIAGLPSSRADVILAGAVIYEGVLQTFGFAELRISTRGLRFAAVREKP